MSMNVQCECDASSENETRSSDNGNGETKDWRIDTHRSRVGAIVIVGVVTAIVPSKRGLRARSRVGRGNGVGLLGAASPRLRAGGPCAA